METDKKNSQSEKFKAAARELGCDEDEARFEDALRKIVKHKPPSEASDTADKPKAKKPKNA